MTIEVNRLNIPCIFYGMVSGPMTIPFRHPMLAVLKVVKLLLGGDA
jgi:hypothetical protein